MSARGPDGKGFYRDSLGRCLLGHRRLAIIDLSEAGAQPMSLGDLTIVFNGEIYNYRALRADLERSGVQFKTQSDTEVMLQLFRRRGIAMISLLRGMFAFAIWNTTTRSLYLARDPHGIKPLYYADEGGCFTFASSVRALTRGQVSKDIDPAAILGFLGWGNVPEPGTMYRSVRALPAGTTLEITEKSVGVPSPYWSVLQAYEHTETVSSESTEALVRRSLIDSTAAHLVADVPVGVFLSSGIDSSVLVALTSEIGSQPVHAVTLAFEEFKGTPEDEAPAAREVASLYGAKHSIVEVSAKSVRASFTDFLSAMDQPSVDGLNIYWVSKAVRQTGLKAALSGLGGDELFGGYSSFRLYPRLRRFAVASRVPGVARGANWLGRLSLNHRAGKISALGGALATPASTYQLVRGLFTPDEVRDIVHPDIWESGRGLTAMMWPVEDALKKRDLDTWSQVAVAEQCVYMRNQLLRDADWASMKHSLEVRVPLVDRQLTDCLAARVSGSKPGKALLASSPRRPLPSSVLRRKKTGFALPMQRWISEDVEMGTLRWPPDWLLGPKASDFRAQLQSGLSRGRVHWSRIWALHCLGSWLDR